MTDDADMGRGLKFDSFMTCKNKQLQKREFCEDRFLTTVCGFLFALGIPCSRSAGRSLRLLACSSQPVPQWQLNPEVRCFPR